MAYYPVPNENDTAGMFELFRYINMVTDGYFFTVILFVIWIVVFIAGKQYSNSRAWTAASFICAIIGIPLAVLGLLSPKWMYLMGLFMAIGLVWIKLESSQG